MASRLNKHLFLHLNFFALAVDNPNIIVNYLSLYSDIEESIERELVQLVYLGKLSLIDASLMNFNQRRFWIKEISEINKKQSASAPSGETDLNTLF